MKKLSTIVVGLSILTSSALYAQGNDSMRCEMNNQNKSGVMHENGSDKISLSYKNNTTPHYLYPDSLNNN